MVGFILLLFLGHPAAALHPLAVPSECPVAVATEYSDSYNIWAKGRRHKGIDLYAYEGAPIVAPENGVVSFGNGRKGGLTAYVTTPTGFRYYFAHMAFQANAGRRGLDVDSPVAAGELIGLVGNTGNARGTSPHLHYEARYNGRRLNPFPQLQTSCNTPSFVRLPR